MFFDLYHNKIVKETISEQFETAVRENLAPIIEDKYGESVLGIQMYEDYISDNFVSGGAWYYPMTLVTEAGHITEWVRWYADAKATKDGSPYSYSGSEPLEFELVDAPAEFAAKLEGRATYCEGGILPVRIDTVVPSVTFLSGKYSQTFIDEMSRQLTAAICEAMSVETLEGSSLELALVFAPETYMEHTSENVTYRRLLLVDKSSAPRDFWIKWTRNDGATAYSVADHVAAASITFEIGEDVSQKIREKEYRCLIRLGKDKYHNAMGRKNVTEWRELIKRAIKRGELVRVERVSVADDENDALSEQLARLLGTTIPAADSAPTALDEQSESDEFALAMRKLAEAAVGDRSDDEAETQQTSDSFVFPEEPVEDEPVIFEGAPRADELVSEAEEAIELEEPEEVEESEEPEELDEYGNEEEDDDVIAEQLSLDADMDSVGDADETFDEDAENGSAEDELLDEDGSKDDECVAEPTPATELSLASLYACTEDSEAEECEASEDNESNEEIDEPESEDDIDDDGDIEIEIVAYAEEEEQAEQPVDAAAVEVEPADTEKTNAGEVEARIREELEAKIRLEYESRARVAAEEEAGRLRREQEQLRLENERLQAQMARERREQAIKEDELRAEEARLRAQIEMQLRAETRERERLAEAARVAVEQQRKLEEERERIEAERAEEARIAEENRRRAEEEARIAEARRLEAERINREKEAAKTAPVAEPAPETHDTKYTYTSKLVKLKFRRSVDPNITNRIHEIIKLTLEYYKKDKIYLKVRASIPDSETVHLEFIKIPMEEMELLGNIVKVLGNSGLGIAKAILE